MLDTRCYNCGAGIESISDSETTQYSPKFSEYEYQGKGIFKCPKCGHILDLSSDTYTIKILRFCDEDTWELDTKILEFDLKLTGEGKDIFEQDMYDMNAFDSITAGKYELEVLWYYYQCGGYEFPDEYDLKLEILSEEKI